MRSTAPSAASACSATDAGLPRPAAGVIRSRFLFAVACAAFTLALAGCGTLPRNAVPTELVGEARVANLPDVRAWAGRQSAAFQSDLAQSFAQESRGEFPVGPDGRIHYAHLALSGGGANGAFGAGFLNGWTRSGQRPVFKIVTGVSTGALMAPFAFLGTAYDDALREFYTTTDTRNIFRRLSILPQLVAGEALADTGPLQALIAQHVDEAFLRNVADAHRRGRRLYVGTADLDAQRFIVWNMGLIAASGRPEAVELFRKVMLASASIPVAFPPVFFDVEAGGGRYDEMHVDGSVGTRVFYTVGVFSFGQARAEAGRGPGQEDLFIIHNGQLQPVPSPTRRSLRAIAMRVFDSSGKAAVVGDLFRIYAITSREQTGYHWTTIPEGVELVGDEVFDPVKMRALYDLGFRGALAGPAWSTKPPGVTAASPP
ncbi:MAG: patatin-like phospholipase family protein [Betaproteobacteria bacterium]|nr:patatin-like phospholipase family protein [Betaproteobacteria bacterium]